MSAGTRKKSSATSASDHLSHYPGFSLEAAKFLVKTRDVVGLGIDTMSVDIGATTTYPVHQFTSKQSVYHLENVANLGLVPAVRSDGGGRTHQAGKRLRRPGAGAGAGEVAVSFSHSAQFDYFS